MLKLSARNRIAIGQVFLVMSALMCAFLLGLVPDRRAAVIEGRGQLSEAIALRTSAAVSQRDIDGAHAVLEAIVHRNPQVMSAAIRRNGEFVVEVGDHAPHWTDIGEERSVDTQVQVPIRVGDEKWGTTEVRFRSIGTPGLIGYLTSPAIRLVLFIGLVSYLMFQIYLKRVLQHLDPSNAVPSRVRSALDALTEGLLILDRQERILLANNSFAGLVNMSPEKLVGHKASDLPWVDGDLAPIAGDWPWVRALDEECPQPNVTLRIQKDDGETRAFLVNSSPVLGHDGKYRGVLVSFDDVTQLEQNKAELSESKEQAESANRAKSEFLANMSHEIRTPMNAILGFTDVMRRGLDKDEGQRQRHLNTIHSSGTHLINLINDILDLSKVESGRLEVEQIRFEPHRVIQEVATVMSVRADAKNISLEVRYDSPIPETIQGDPGRLRQIITNLVGNAIKFTDSGSVSIETRTSADSQLVIDIVDTGVGMTQAAQQKIFEAFGQADASVTRTHGGTGLGLTISKRFAVALGGDISVTSIPGKGSIFSVTIDPGPLETIRLIQPTSDDLQKFDETDTNDVLLLPPMRVLIVDDAEENRDLLAVILEEAGVSFSTVESGLAAIEQVSTESWDVVLMDMQMPVMDGYTATRRLREMGYDVPIVAFTAHAMQGDKEKCMAAGCTGFLTKPIDLNKLITTLAEIAGVVPGSTADRTIAGQLAATESFQESDATTADMEPEFDGIAIESTLPTHKPKFRDIVRKFAVRLHDQVPAFEAAFSTKDYDTLASLAHWLKGSGGNCGFAPVADIAKQLETQAKNHADQEISQTLRKLRNIISRMVVPPAPAEPELVTA